MYFWTDVIEITMYAASNVLESIGNTPIAQLRRVVPPGSARVLAKLEWANPTGSMKDRMARAVIESFQLLRVNEGKEDSEQTEQASKL